MKKKKYIRCTIKDDGKGAMVELNANDKELIAMVCTIVYDVAATLGIEIEKFCTGISKMTVTVAKNMTTEDKKEEFGNENYVF